MIGSGSVQGSGLWYITGGAARQCLLKGEVENPEGETVRMACGGEEEEEESIGQLVEEARNAKKAGRGIPGPRAGSGTLG